MLRCDSWAGRLLLNVEAPRHCGSMWRINPSRHSLGAVGFPIGIKGVPRKAQSIMSQQANDEDRKVTDHERQEEGQRKKNTGKGWKKGRRRQEIQRCGEHARSCPSSVILSCR